MELTPEQTKDAFLADHEVVVHVAELEDELETISPRPTKLKAALGAIGRIAGPAALETVKAAVEGAVAGLVKGSGII